MSLRVGIQLFVEASTDIDFLKRAPMRNDYLACMVSSVWRHGVDEGFDFDFEKLVSHAFGCATKCFNVAEITKLWEVTEEIVKQVLKDHSAGKKLQQHYNFQPFWILGTCCTREIFSSTQVSQ